MTLHKPHVILHIGSSKTGSTALQTACRRHAKALLAAGVLYPEVRSHAVSHHFLGMLMRPPGEQARAYGEAYLDRPQLLQADFAAQWRSVQRQVQRWRPQVLLLSSETLFIVPQPERAAQLRRLLGELASSVEIVAYIRRPAEFYLSRVQQDLKHAGSFAAPGAVQFREIIESWERLFDVPLKVAPFEREALRDGDIFRDFLSRFLPQIPLREEWVAERENQTLSAELMALMQDYHRTNHPHKGRWAVEDSRRLRLLLQKIDQQEEGVRRPQLHPAIAAHVDHSSVDLLWLEERHGIRFAGVDQALIGTADATAFQDVRRVADLCEVDPQRQDRLLLLALHRLLQPRWQWPDFVQRWRARYLNTPGLRVVRRWLRPLRRKLNVWL